MNYSSDQPQNYTCNVPTLYKHYSERTILFDKEYVILRKSIYRSSASKEYSLSEETIELKKSNIILVGRLLYYHWLFHLYLAFFITTFLILMYNLQASPSNILLLPTTVQTTKVVLNRFSPKMTLLILSNPLFHCQMEWYFPTAL